MFLLFHAAKKVDGPEIGWYKMTSIESSGKVTKASEFEKYGMTSTIVFSDDGTGYLNLMGQPTKDFEWENGKITTGGNLKSYSLSGDNLKLYIADDYIMEFTRKTGDLPERIESN